MKGIIRISARTSKLAIGSDSFFETYLATWV